MPAKIYNVCLTDEKIRYLSDIIRTGKHSARKVSMRNFRNSIRGIAAAGHISANLLYETGEGNPSLQQFYIYVINNTEKLIELTLKYIFAGLCVFLCVLCGKIKSVFHNCVTSKVKDLRGFKNPQVSKAGSSLRLEPTVIL